MWTSTAPGIARILFAQLLRDRDQRLELRSHDLDVDRRRQAEVEDLRDDVGGLEVERHAREALGQRHPQRALIADRRPVVLAKRDEHLRVLTADVVGLDEREVVRGRDADVVVDDRDLLGRHDLADRLLDLADDLLGLLDPRAERGAHVQPHLTGVDQGKEVGADGEPEADAVNTRITIAHAIAKIRCASTRSSTPP